MADKKLEIIIQLRDLATQAIKILSTNLKNLAKKGFNVAQKAVDRFRSRLNNLKKLIFSFKGLIATLGLAALTKAFLNAGNTAESLRVRLSVLTGSIREGNRMFREMAQLASTVPQTFEEIMESATRLIGVVNGGVDQVKELMPLILDLSTATGLGVNDVTAQVIRMWSAGAAAADMFRERGVLAMLGFQAGATYSVAETRRMLMEAWTGPTSKFRDASKALATTWRGLMSMLQDAWFQFRVAVMDAGVMDWIKGALSVLLADIRALKADTAAYGHIVEQVSNTAISFLKSMAYAIAGVIDLWRGLKMIVTALGLAFAEFAVIGATVWKGLKLIFESIKLGLIGLELLVSKVVKASAASVARLLDQLTSVVKGLREIVAAVNSWDTVGVIPDKALSSLYKAEQGIAKAASAVNDFGRETEEYWDKAYAAQEKVLNTTAFADSPALKYWRDNRDALAGYLKELSQTEPAVQQVMDFFDRVDKQMERLAEERERLNEETARRRAKLVAEPFAFSAVEQQAQAVSAGALKVKAAMVELDQQYETSKITLEEYYDRKRELQEEQYNREINAQMTALDELEKNEIERRRDIANQILEIEQQIADGIRDIDDVATQNMLDQLKAKELANKEYLEKKIALNEELQQTEIEYMEQLYKDMNELRRKQLQAVQSTTAGMASAFEDMYNATGKKSKEFFYAWKAMQIAETIISTYAAAQKAYETASGIPLVGTYMGPIAAALAVAQGMARVAMIRSQTMAAGGKVMGVSPTATADNIPAMLTAGEYVQPVDVVKHYGVQAMEALRKRIVPREVLSRFGAGGLAPAPAGVLRMAAGGTIPSPREAMRETDGGRDQGVNITNVIDPQIMEQYVASKPGERSVMNVISKNQFQLRQLMEQ